MDKFNFIKHNFNNTSNAPQYKERVSRQGWITYGDDNLYPEYLISLMNRSTKHNAILKRKASMIAGNGFSKEGLDNTAINFIYNPYNTDTLDDIVYKCAYDLEIFGSFSLEIIYSKDKSKIAEINYLPNNKIRLSEDLKSIYYSDDWSNLRKFGPEKYPILNLKNPTSNQILYFKEYRAGNEYYSQPDYISAVNYIEMEYEISEFHLSQIKNGFTPAMMISFYNGIPTEEERDDIVRQLKKDYKGAKNAGEVMFVFADKKENGIEVTPIQTNDSDSKYIELSKQITEGILTGHNVTNPGLFGISTPGELGQKNVILESLEIFQSTYINPKQKLIEGVFNKLLSFNNSQSKLVLNKYELDIQKIEGENE